MKNALVLSKARTLGGFAVARGVADTEMIRRTNRERVLDAIRREGPMSRSRIATLTGLSNASLSAIGSDLVAQGILREVEAGPGESKGRGRPAVGLGHNRAAAYVILIELDVNRCRLSMLDYGGVLVDRIESQLTPDQFEAQRPDLYLLERIGVMAQRNPSIMDRLANISISVQGMLGPHQRGLKWSPLPKLAGFDLVGPITQAHGVPTRLYKRGRLMADGTRWLHPGLAHTTYATVFVGATIGMGLSFPAESPLPADIGTDFGHMNHVPDGALCRCGARGCIEAYAADYGVLRTAFSVPDHTAPASAVPTNDYQQIVARARAGDRNAMQAFNTAGRALGFGINRLMSIVDLSHIVLLGPGIQAFDLMRPAFEDGALASLTGRINGVPQIILTADAGEPIYRGLMMKALTTLDRERFAPVTGAASREVAE